MCPDVKVWIEYETDEGRANSVPFGTGDPGANDWTMSVSAR